MTKEQQTIARVLIYTGDPEWIATTLFRSLRDGIKTTIQGSITAVTIPKDLQPAFEALLRKALERRQLDALPDDIIASLENV